MSLYKPGSPLEYDVRVTAPTMAAFHRSNAGIRGVLGPYGSGKSVGMCMEIFRRASEQRAGADGVRRSVWAIVRNTYSQLKTTTVKTWRECIPTSWCPMTYGSPFRGVLQLPLDDGTRIECEVLFFSMDREKDVRKVLSLELTGVWVNEARELLLTLVHALAGRCGRYPAKDDGGPSWTGVIMDTNMPDDEHWLYRFAEKGAWRTEFTELQNNPAWMREQLLVYLGGGKDAEVIADRTIAQLADTTIDEGFRAEQHEWKFWRQPGGLVRSPDGKGYLPNPAAENIQHLSEGYGYYLKKLAGRSLEYIKTNYLAEYGSTFEGRPVYEPYWNEARHVSKAPIEIVRELPFYLFWDFALHPACVVAQLLPTGQLRVLRELWHEHAGVKQFAQEMVMPMLAADFSGMRLAGAWGDPTGNTGSQADIEVNAFAMLESLGLPALPAPTNLFPPRRDAVLEFLRRVGGFLLDLNCRLFRKGFNGGYRYSRIQCVGEERYQEKPVKDKHSHIQDALQAGCLGLLGADRVARETARRVVPPPLDARLVWDSIT